MPTEGQIGQFHYRRVYLTHMFECKEHRIFRIERPAGHKLPATVISVMKNETDTLAVTNNLTHRNCRNITRIFEWPVAVHLLFPVLFSPE